MKEIVSVFLCGKIYGVEVSEMRGVENYQDFVKTGNEPDFLEGIVEIRNEFLPLVALKNNLVMPATPVTPETKIMLMMTDHGHIGAVVDGVSGIFRVEDQEIKEFPQLMKNGKTSYAKFVAKNKENDLVIVLDPNNLLDQEQWDMVDKYVKDYKEESDKQED